MLIPTIRIGILLVITLAYALFDALNNRNVPNAFAYASVVVGIAVLLATYGTTVIAVGALIAAVVGALGYVLYRVGFLGGGDVFEFVAIILLLPLQPAPLLGALPQFNLPFILSVFISTGIVVLWAVPIYYLLFVKGREKTFRIPRRAALSAIALLAAYLLLFLAIDFAIGFNPTALALILLIAVPSALMLAFQKLITARMVADVYPSALEDGDIIATNMMQAKDLRFFAGKSKSFQRLVTPKLMKDLKGVKRRLPVYKNAVPLAFYTFIGVLIALAFGNLLLYVVF